MRLIKVHVPLLVLVPLIGVTTFGFGFKKFYDHLSKIQIKETEEKTPFRLFWEGNEGTFKILTTYIRNNNHCVMIEGKTKQRYRLKLAYNENVLVGETWLTEFDNNNDTIYFTKLVD